MLTVWKPLRRFVQPLHRVLSSNFSRTSYNQLSNDESLPKWVPQMNAPRPNVDMSRVPRQTDVLIIGGGLVGQAIAYFLKLEDPLDMKVTIVERDPSYKIATSALCTASIRQQFSLPENVQLSLFAAKFLRKAKEHLSVENSEPVDVNFGHVPYLFLAETDQQAAILERNHKVQRENGADVKLVSPAEIKRRYPWLNVDNVKVCSIGVKNEGYFDPWALLMALKAKNLALGVRYVHGEVEGFEFRKELSPKAPVEVESAIVSDLHPEAKQKGPYAMKFWRSIVASGCWSGQLATKLGIGQPGAPDKCKVPLPVEPKKRYRYIAHSAKGPALDCPMVCDPNGLLFRRDGFGGHIMIAGTSTIGGEPDPSHLEPDDHYFTEKLFPLLAKRAPCYEDCNLAHSWAVYYDMNTLDQNLIIGPHSYFKNIYFATGLSGHGDMHAIGVGRAMSDLIHFDKYKTIDLTRFGFDRILANKPLWDDNMVFN